jgi:putative integral membrane protein (TIGR02587 family)
MGAGMPPKTTAETTAGTRSQAAPRTHRAGNRRFAVGLARAFAGALIFTIPMLMTMEMWWLGFSMSPGRLALFTLLALLLFVRLAHDQGFETSVTWRAAIIDAFVGYAVGAVTAAVILPLLGIIQPGMAWDEVIGKIAIQAIPGAIGALLARSQLGEHGKGEDGTENAGAQSGAQSSAQPGAQGQDGSVFSPVRYGAELYTMVVGALFLAFNVAPTEEMELISYMMNPWLGIATVLLSLAILHIFVYEVDFRGEHKRPADMGFGTLFLRFTVTGYALVLLVCLYLLWSFGRLDSTSITAALMMTIVLAFPGTLGAAAARLIL